MIKPRNTLPDVLLCYHSHLICVVGNIFNIIYGRLLYGYRFITMQSDDTYRQNYSRFRSLKMFGFWRRAQNKQSEYEKSVNIDMDSDVLQYAIYTNACMYNRYKSEQGMAKNSEWVLVMVVLATLVANSQQVVIKMKKQNILLQQNSNYTFKLDIVQSKSLINPIQLEMDHMIYNSFGTTNLYFDYFKYLSEEDIACYNYSIGNSSYLYPCPFLTNNDTILRNYFIYQVWQTQDQMIRNMNQIHQHFILDNTPYPFPNGAYPFTDILLTSTTTLSIQFNDSYKNAGIRLIFITVTLIVVYTFVIGVLIFRTRKIEKQMLKRAPNYKIKRRPSQLSRQNNDIREQDEQSDIDNYEQIVPNQLSLRYSRDSKDRDQYKFKRRQRLEDPQQNDKQLIVQRAFQNNRENHDSDRSKKSMEKQKTQF